MKNYYCFNKCPMQLNKLVSLLSTTRDVLRFLQQYKIQTLSICLEDSISSSMHCQKSIIPHSSIGTAANFSLFIEISGELHNVQQSRDQSDQI